MAEKMAAMTTADRMDGTYMTKRRKPEPMILSCVRMAAKMMAIGMVIEVTTTSSRIVFWQAWTKFMSPASVLKFCSPTKVWSPEKPLHLKNDMRNTLNVGTTMKMMKRIAVGSVHRTPNLARFRSSTVFLPFAARVVDDDIDVLPMIDICSRCSDMDVNNVNDHRETAVR